MLKYLVIINIVGFLIMGYDKLQAIKKGYRIPEITLLLIAFIGGSFGSFLGMILFHHKTKKRKFQLLIPISIITTIFIILNQ